MRGGCTFDYFKARFPGNVNWRILQTSIFSVSCSKFRDFSRKSAALPSIPFSFKRPAGLGLHRVLHHHCTLYSVSVISVHIS